jgi:hypothetical protein
MTGYEYVMQIRWEQPNIDTHTQKNKQINKLNDDNINLPPPMKWVSPPTRPLPIVVYPILDSRRPST